MVWGMFRSRRHDRRPAPRFRAPGLEILEDRTAPAVTTGALAAAGPTTPGVFDPTTATWFLRSSNSAGAPDLGQFQYGSPGWKPITGDWSGTGHAGIGVFDPTTATWFLRSETNAGIPDAGQFRFGAPGWVPIVGDWSGTGHAGIGVFDPNTGRFFLRNEASGGAPDAGTFAFGMPGWVPLAGDWNGSGHDGVGAFDPNTATFFLRNEVSGGAPDAGAFAYGMPGWVPLAGDWNASGHDGVGAFDPATATFFLRNEASAGAPDAGQFAFGAPGWVPAVGNFAGSSSGSTGSGGSGGSTTPGTAQPLLTLNLNPLDLRLLGLEVQTNQITVTVSAQPGQGQLLGNLLTSVSNLLNLPSVNNALNNVLGSVVSLLNSVDLNVNGVDTSGSLGSADTAATTPVLDLFVAPVHLNLLGALVDTSPIHLTITAHSGQGLLLGNIVTDLANLFNPPLPDKLDIDTINSKLEQLLAEVNQQIPNIGSAPITTPTIPAGSSEILALAVPPIDVNLLGLVLKTSQIQVNADALTGNGNLLGNVLTTLLNTLGATPQNIQTLNSDLNALLAKVIGVLNASNLVLPPSAIDSLSQVLQTLALPNLINTSGGSASTPILNLAIASPDNSTPPVNVNLLGLKITTSDIQAQLLAQTGDGQILGNLLFNVANLLNPGSTFGLLSLLNDLGL